MSEIHINHLTKYFDSTYRLTMDMSDQGSGESDTKNSIFNSRSVTALGLQKICGIDAKTACSAVVDGSDDQGIDGVYVDKDSSVLYLMQSKFSSKGKGTITLGGVEKFLSGVRKLVSNKLDDFNTKVKSKSMEIEAALDDADTKICLVLAHTGTSELSSDVASSVTEYLTRMNDPNEVVFSIVFDQQSLHNYLTDERHGSPINEEVLINQWGVTSSPQLSYFGLVALADVAKWFENSHTRLFEPNFRHYLGSTEINKQIIETLRSQPDNFQYYNNGITVLCSKIKKKPLGGETSVSGSFECENLRIVNGAQTAGTIYNFSKEDPDNRLPGFVFVRFISLENADRHFGENVTRYTNTQNQIRAVDYVSGDKEQRRLSDELMMDDIDYRIKSQDDEEVDSSKSFNIAEATIALACASRNMRTLVKAKSGISKLWVDLNSETYKALFNKGLSGRELFNLVKIHRVINRKLRWFRNGVDNPNPHKGRDRLFLSHGDRFIAFQVFKRISRQGLERPEFDIIKIKDEVETLTAEMLTKTIEVTDNMDDEVIVSALFKNLNKCQSIDESLNRGFSALQTDIRFDYERSEYH